MFFKWNYHLFTLYWVIFPFWCALILWNFCTLWFLFYSCHIFGSVNASVYWMVFILPVRNFDFCVFHFHLAFCEWCDITIFWSDICTYLYRNKMSPFLNWDLLQIQFRSLAFWHCCWVTKKSELYLTGPSTYHLRTIMLFVKYWFDEPFKYISLILQQRSKMLKLNLYRDFK